MIRAGLFILGAMVLVLIAIGCEVTVRGGAVVPPVIIAPLYHPPVVIYRSYDYVVIVPRQYRYRYFRYYYVYPYPPRRWYWF